MVDVEEEKGMPRWLRRACEHIAGIPTCIPHFRLADIWTFNIDDAMKWVAEAFQKGLGIPRISERSLIGVRLPFVCCWIILSASNNTQVLPLKCPSTEVSQVYVEVQGEWRQTNKLSWSLFDDPESDNTRNNPAIAHRPWHNPNIFVKHKNEPATTPRLQLQITSY